VILVGRVVSAHTASQIISTVTVLAADQPAAVAVALAVVSDALKHRSGRRPADTTAVADLVRLPSPIWVISGLQVL
jgi:hypothetical protein